MAGTCDADCVNFLDACLPVLYRPSVPGVRRTLTRSTALASRAKRPLMIRQETWPGRGANGQEAPTIDARQLDVNRRAGLITALTSPTGSSAPMGGCYRGFRGPCVSPIINKSSEPEFGVLMGILDHDPSARPTLHRFVASKAPWFEITDALP